MRLIRILMVAALAALTACSSNVSGNGSNSASSSSSAPSSPASSSTAPSSSGAPSSSAPSSRTSSSGGSGGGDWTTGVDFSTLHYPGLDCSAADQDGKVDVLKVKKGDVTGDGVIDAVVRVECAHSASEWPDSVYVLTKGSSGPEFIGALIEQPDDEYATSISLGNKVVTLGLAGWSPDAPGCCPDLKYTQTFQWDSSAQTFHNGPKVSVLRPCGDTAFTVSLTDAQGATGHSSVVLLFRNKLPQPCTVRGYPGLDAITSSGSTLAHATRTLHGFAGGAHAIQTFTVNTGSYVSATLEWLNFNPTTGGDCQSSAKIATTPPNTTATVELNQGVTVCGLQIHPVVAGQSGNA